MKKYLTLLALPLLALASAGCSDKTKCGTGTTKMGDDCIAALSCGTGTTEMAGKCVPTGTGGKTCGTGTTDMNGTCIGDLSCGAGTTEDNGSCVPDGSGGLTCGTGTTEMNGMCISTGSVSCGAGTTEMAGSCVPDVVCGAGTMADNGECLPTPPAIVYHQIEHLARPGINEALIISDAFHTGYNATAPTFAGVDATTLGLVVAEAKTVLKALYLGGCLLNGTIPGITAATGVHPGGLECHAIGPALWEENALDGVTLTQASQDSAQAYADAVFGLFEPDVLRVDTGVTSSYETLCGAGTVGLCGGRFLRDDAIDITYDFLLNGAGTCAGGLCGAPNQVNSLVADGVSFDNADPMNNVSQRIDGNPNNRQQGHPDVSNTFPYSAPPH
jgi:hypothetical protein